MTYFILFAFVYVTMTACWLLRQRAAWRYYLVLNRAALAESRMGPSINQSKTAQRGGMSFWEFLKCPLSRMIYGARLAEYNAERMREAGFTR